MKERVLAELKHHGYRLTEARRAIATALEELSPGLWTAEAVHHRVVRRRGDCDLASVYRTLNVLVEIGVLRVSDVFGTTQHFEPANAGHRHPIICRRCHDSASIDICAMKAFERELGRLGFTQVRHRLEFTGLCRKCS